MQCSRHSSAILGIGALYVRRRPRVRLEAQMSGGGQERGMRSGTLPAPLCVGLGAACAIAERERDFDYKHVTRLANRLIDGINSKLPQVVRNGDPQMWYPGMRHSAMLLLTADYFRMRQPVVRVRRGRESSYGAEGRGAIFWERMHICESRTLLRTESDRSR